MRPAAHTQQKLTQVSSGGWIYSLNSSILTRGGGGLPYITDGDARRNFQKQPLKVTMLGVAPANFIP